VIQTIAELQRTLEALLTTAAGANKVNRLDAQAVRRETAAFRREIDADNVAHGEPVGSPDWNLLMKDASLDEDAVFVITAFVAGRLRILAGRGKGMDVIAVSNDFTLAEVDEALAALERGFRIEGVLEVSQTVVQEWLGAP